MKFEAAATAPGWANCSQNGTDPSAKSIQTGFFPGSEQASAVAALGAPGRAEAVRPTTAASRTSRETLFTRGTLTSRKSGGATVAGPPLYVSRLRLGLVQRRVDREDRLGFSLFLRRVLLAVVGSAAEVEPKAGEARAVAAVAANLLQRREQGLALVRLGRHLLGGADVDLPVTLETGRGRDQLADDHVLLQAEQAVDLPLDRGVGEHLRRLLEGRCREERLGRERRFRDPEDQRFEGRLLLLLLLDAGVLAVEHDLVDELAGQQVGVTGALDAHLLEHLADDQLDVLVVDVD